MDKLTIDRLREVLELDPSTGTLFWKQKVAKKIVIGTEAGYVRPDGYKIVQIDKARILNHHAVFALTYGRWPASELDHVNRNPADNRPCNLREASRCENNYNRGKPKHNTSGIKGVFKQRKGKTWSARLTTNKVLKRVGGFETPQLAHEFLELWRSIAHGEFAHGEIA